ncbi:MAG TPA: isoprenylcysteine carboxylmethyltransferase family protein [Candidatus Krumholzibacteria bacterium]|nr:isoprenylcysteine carboxylmethyltransferase family protein [Candidatus Krumholzibacteria bacterium]
MTPAVAGALIALLTVIIVQRVTELLLSARNARRVIARGGREMAAAHFPLLVLVHTLFPVGIAAEVLGLGARPGTLWPLWTGLWLGAQILRYAAIRALGDRWNVRVLVLPGAPLVRTGPYRYLRHPNYIAVAIELATAPLILGAWRTALVISIFNVFALRTRIRAEEAALRAAAQS